MPLLESARLRVDFGSPSRPLPAVDDFSVSLEEGDVVGIIGESGSGKTASMLALMGLIGWPGRVTADRLRFAGIDLTELSASRRRHLLGRQMAMVFQDPLSSLDPCFPIGFQIAEVLAAHTSLARRARRTRVIELLRLVGFPAAEHRLCAFPHQLSGGMNQRAMIAMALACGPRLLIADEPTTALDVTVQAQILELLTSIQRETRMALLLVSHDFGVIASAADRVLVMYAGRVVEDRPTTALLHHPRHPYTRALLDASLAHAFAPSARVGSRIRPHLRRPLATVPGTVPALGDRPRGCAFHPRCPLAVDVCRMLDPPLLADGIGCVRCHFPLHEPRER